MEKDRVEFNQKTAQLEKERIAELLIKSNINPKDLLQPLPVSYTTFEKLFKTMEVNRKENSQKKGLGFGVGPRLPLSDQDKWKVKVERYNITRENPIDPNLDIIPAPNAYPLIAYWPGKIGKNSEKNGPKKASNILKVISKGPIFSPYYTKI